MKWTMFPCPLALLLVLPVACVTIITRRTDPNATASDGAVHQRTESDGERFHPVLEKISKYTDEDLLKDGPDVEASDSHKAEEDQGQIGNMDGHETHAAENDDGHGKHAAESHDGHGKHAAGGHDGDGKHAAESHDIHGEIAAEGNVAKCVAVCLMSSVMMLPVGVYMLMSGGQLGRVTLQMLDTFISIFLAVLWFNFFETALRFSGVRRAFPGAEQVVAVLHLFALYGIAVFIAYLWRDHHMSLVTFCSCGAHYIAFAGIAGGSSLQSGADIAWCSFTFCVITCLVFAAASFATHFLLLDKINNRRLFRAIDELELDIIGLVLSFMITQAIRHAITGEYPAAHFIQKNATTSLRGANYEMNLLASPGHHGSKAWHRYFMLLWSMMLSVITFVLLPLLHRFESLGYWADKLIHVVKVLVVMLMAWGYLLWGQWEFEATFKGEKMFGYIVFATIATMVCFALLFFMSWLDVHKRTMHESIGICITGISLVAAWSWEHCFNVAFDVIGDEFQVGYGGLVPKGILALGIPAFVLPTYLMHIKPWVIENEEKSEMDHGKRTAPERRPTANRAMQRQGTHYMVATASRTSPRDEPS